MGDADKPFVDGFTAAAVILAVATVLFGVRYPEIVAVLEEDVPGGIPEKKAYRGRMWTAFFARVLPLLILFWAFALLPLPGTVQILRALDFDPGHYDFVRAAWVATDAVTVYFAVWTTSLAFRLLQAVRAAA